MGKVVFLGIVLTLVGGWAQAGFAQQATYSGPAEFIGGAAASEAPPCCGCCPPCWKQCTALSADFLYLRPSNDRVPVAVPINGAIIPPPNVAPAQAGTTALVDVDYQPAFRVGGSWGLNECARVGLSYTRFEGSDNLDTTTVAPLVLRSQVSHPGTFSSPTDFLAAQADEYIQFQLADVDYRRILWSSDCYAINYLIGARYAHMSQKFNSALSNSTTVETVNTRLNFDGGGLRLGIEGERYSPCSGWMIYGSAAASFLGGVSQGTFLQRNSTAAVDPLVTSGWSEDRLVPILEIEAGIGWTSQSGCLQVKAGYLVSSWFNMATTDRYIQSVHQNQLDGLDKTITFDGLSLRTEIRF